MGKNEYCMSNIRVAVGLYKDIFPFTAIESKV